MAVIEVSVENSSLELSIIIVSRVPSVGEFIAFPTGWFRVSKVVHVPIEYRTQDKPVAIVSVSGQE